MITKNQLGDLLLVPRFLQPKERKPKAEEKKSRGYAGKVLVKSAILFVKPKDTCCRCFLAIPKGRSFNGD